MQKTLFRKGEKSSAILVIKSVKRLMPWSRFPSQMTPGIRQPPRRVKLLAPSHITWSANDVQLGAGSLEVEVPADTPTLSAHDGRRGVTSTLPTLDVVSYEALPRTRVRIFVRPWAEAAIGDEKLGVTPLPPLLLVPGSYTLRLVHGEQEQVHTIEVGAEPLDLRYRFSD